MGDYFADQKRILQRRNAPQLDRDKRVGGQGPGIEVARARAFASVPKDGSEDFTGYPRLPAADPTDPLHPAKTERVNEVEENADSRLRRDGSEPVEGDLMVRPVLRPEGSIYHELTAYYGTSTQNISLRFHQENRWWKRITVSDWGFALYEGEPNSGSYVKLWAADFEGNGGVTLSSRASEANSVNRYNSNYNRSTQLHTDAVNYANTRANQAQANAIDYTQDNYTPWSSFSGHTHNYAASNHGHSYAPIGTVYSHWHYIDAGGTYTTDFYYF